ncbi:MAG: hydrolase, partial [Clostridia bacterium]|nr:hydrolase [Clostridia bacterium]
VNAPTLNDTIRRIHAVIDIPIVITIVSEHEDTSGRFEAGASILNVSAAAKTPEVVRILRAKHPEAPIIATGGPTEESIARTIEAGANAITWTPPTTGELFRTMMERYRENISNPDRT